MNEFTFKEAKAKPELKDTVKLMLSDNYQDRFEAELMQINIRIERLENILDKHYSNRLEFAPKTKIPLLEAQLSAMRLYRSILVERKDQEENTAESHMGNHITRDEAAELLYSLSNDGGIDAATSGKLAEIANIIEDEQLGYHFWGADSAERAKLFTATRADLITPEYKEELVEIANKYSFCPSDAERDEINEAIEEEGDIWDEWEDK